MGVHRHFTRIPVLGIVSLVALSASARAQTVSPDAFGGLKWREIGPFRGGRSLAVAGSTQRPDEYFFGATGGGVWKTTDAGKSWKPVSDGFFKTASVGALAVAPSNPDIIVAGTGERDIRGNISHGDGVYKSTDAGKTWQKIGLEAAQSIARVVIHPTNPDVIYVAALGHIYAHPKVKPSYDRGVYKSIDGGKSWAHILPGDARTGSVNIVLDPKNPETILAAMWEAWRSPYTMNSGGPGSKLMKSTDGGKSWTDLSRKKGMPEGVHGKIGMAISPVDPKRYYAIIEALEGGILKSDDAGETWEKVNDDRNWRQRAWYYTHVYADPKEKEGLYVLNVGAGKSTDGGKKFSGLRTPHSDNHDLWIAPDNPLRMINANDGGANVSTDGGKTWTEQTFPTAQFYHVSTDNAFPYRILGAQQDNSTIRIPSRTQGNGIGLTDWTSTAGGESGYVAAKPNDPDLVFGGSYGGDLSWINHRTDQSGSVDPWPDNPMGHGAIDLVQRFQWTYPIVFSPHDPNLLYTCSQFVLKTTNNGQSWTKISPDLTRNDPSTMGPSGGPITKDNTSVEYYGTVFTVAESPKKRGTIWAGSDDGLVHITQDGGKSWTKITPKGVPDWALISMVDPSPHKAGTAYLAVDNHENDDLRPYAFRTDDFGKTWTSITNGLPNNAFLRVIREDRKRPGLLYAGTEIGIYVSFDNGSNWQSLALNMPVVPVHDLAWKDDDLIAATHGRSFWVLDDLSPLQQLAPSQKLDKPILFAPRDSYAVRWGGRGNAAAGAGANPPSGVIVSYYLPKKADKITIEFSGPDGKVFQTAAGASGEPGFQRTTAFLQESSWKSVPGMILWGAFPSSLIMPPGKYMVHLTVDGVKQSAKFNWKHDPRIPATEKDLQEKHVLLKQIAKRTDDANNAVLEIRRVRDAFAAKKTEASAKGLTPIVKEIDDLSGMLTRIEEAIYQTKNRSGQDPLNYPIRLNNRIGALMNVVQSGAGRPTAQSREVYKMLDDLLDTQLRNLSKVIAAFIETNGKLKQNQIAEVPNLVPNPGK